MVACGSSGSHYWAGYLVSVEHRTEIKWSLKYWMDLSAAFRRWICGGDKLVEYLFLKEGLLEEITSLIIYYMGLGLVYSSCECVKEFLDHFIDVCA